MTRPRHRSAGRAGVVLATLLLGAVVTLIPGAPGATAATTRIEAESIPPPASCWSELSWSRLSGGRARACSFPGTPLTWTVDVASPGTVVRLYGYRDEVARGFRVRIDGTEWTDTVSGAPDPSALFFSSPALGVGSHRFELESASSAGGFTIDFYEVESSGGSSTSVPTTPTTSPGNACPISPGDGEAAITAAIAACPDGSTVQFPQGAVYHQYDPIQVINRSNLVIDGRGATFITSAPNVSEPRPNWRILWARNVTLQNMNVVGNFTLTGPRSLHTVSAIAANQWNAGFHLLGGDGVTIADVTVRDVFGDFVSLFPNYEQGGGSRHGEFPTNVRVVRLQGTRAARHCVAVSAAYGFWLEDSTLRDCWYGGLDAELDALGFKLHDLHILRNTFDGYNLFAIAIPLAGNTGDINGVEIRNNKMITPGDACWPTILINDRPHDPGFFLNVTVEGNHMKTLATGISLDHVNTGTVAANQIEKTAPNSLCGPPAPVPIRITQSSGVAQYGNTVTGYGS